MEYDYFTINFFPFIGTAFLAIFIWRNSHLESRIRKLFYMLLAMVVIELCVYNLELICKGSDINNKLMTFITALGYTLRPLMMYLLLLLILRSESNAKIKIPLFIPAVVNFIFAFSAMFVPFSFYYDSRNEFHRGMFGWTTHIVMLIYLLVMMMISVSRSGRKIKFERTIILEVTIMLTVGAFAESVFGSYAVLRYGIVLSLLFYYMFFQSEMYKDEIIEKHVEQTNMSERLTLQMVTALARAVDAKDSYTNGHSQRVADYSKEISRRLNKDAEFQRRIYYMGMLHDIGKIGVPDTIINKTSRLTDEEYETIKTHPVIGAEVLQTITEIPNLYFGARWHHERYDGRGYPDGLVGDEIPLEARIIAVADAYDAMSSKRSYRDVLPQEKVRDELERAKRTQLDPYLANIMLEMMSEDSAYKMRET